MTREEADVAFFKTPTLRNVLVTAPYFHDGSMETLWVAVDHYNKGDGLKDPWLDDDIEPLALTENEIDDLDESGVQTNRHQGISPATCSRAD